MPASFNFPHTGKLLSLSFVLFAGWFADALVPLSDYPQLALAGLVTFFGSLNAAVPFLLDQFRIPADTFQLFLATGVINSRVGSLVAAVHTLTVALLVACAVTGHLRWRRGPLLSYAGITAALVILVHRRHARAVCQRTVPGVLEGQGAGVDAAAPRTGRAPPWPAPSSPAPATNLPPLETIDARKVLRVGYLPDALPFAFFNQQRRPGGLRRRARAPPGARDGRHPRLRAGRSRAAGGAARGGVLRPRDVGRGRDDEPGAGDALLGFVSGRNPRVRRAGRPARAVRELGRDSRSRRR